MLSSCNLFQLQIKQVAFTLPLQFTLRIVHGAAETCARAVPVRSGDPFPCLVSVTGLGSQG